ncbi:MAG: hypothetical protein ACRD8U_21660, partial [Pyrinomonadaceae bacterium]
ATIKSAFSSANGDWVAEKVEPIQSGVDVERHNLPVLPNEFWDARPVFTHIRTAAWSRNRSGDVALHVVLARLSAMVSHRLRLDTGVGDLTVPLNYYAAIVGESGGGKSSSKAVADRLMPPPSEFYFDMRDDQPLGSGEGLAESFYGTVSEPPIDGKGKPIQKRTVVRNNAFFFCDEGQVMERLQSRNGATLGPQLRSAWTGSALGQANASEDRYRYVPAGSYSLGLIIGFQFNTVQPLLDDVDGGTPQRFAYVAAADPSIPDEAPAWPGTIQLKHETLWPNSDEVFDIDPRIRQEIRTTDTGRNRGVIKYDPLDSQAPLMRIKIAALLALLDDRHNVTLEDWGLASDILT